MKTSLLLFSLLILLRGSVLAQEPPTEPVKKLTYYNYIQSGVLLGKDGTGSSVTLSMVHGIRLGKAALGVGVGYDDYTRNSSMPLYGYGMTIYNHWKSMPIYAAVSMDIFPIKKSVVYLELNGGYSKIWGRDRVEQNFATNIKGGYMLSPLLGLRLTSGKVSLYVSAGYKLQKNEYELHNIYVWAYPSQTTVSETMQRGVVKIGFGLN